MIEIRMVFGDPTFVGTGDDGRTINMPLLAYDADSVIEQGSRITTLSPEDRDWIRDVYRAIAVAQAQEGEEFRDFFLQTVLTGLVKATEGA